MITLITGENSYAASEAINSVVASFDGTPERYDGQILTEANLPELTMGTSLFSPKRLVIIRSLSENKQAWTKFDDYIDAVDADIHLVIIEPKLDKRTKTYKHLAKVATIIEAAQLTGRDENKAVQWLMGEASARGVTLSKQQATHMIQRSVEAGDRPGSTVINQALASQALEVLSLKDMILDEDIAHVLPPTPQENVFELFEAVLSRQPRRVDQMISTLSVHEEAHMVMGLLGGQLFQLAALVLADKPSSDVAKDIGAHPFVLQKLSSYARTMSRSELADLTVQFATADDRLKTSGGDPWTIVWQLLMKIARR